MPADTPGTSGRKAGRVLSDIAESAKDGFRRASHDAASAAERTAPAIKRSVAKGTYTLAYCLSFGAVYCAEVVREMLPDDGVVMQGFRDGAAAARETRAAHDADPLAATTVVPEPAL
ncbi:MAG TPA: hypothetical protein VF698_17485 [Thermoanaerobaculia bacterium]